MKKPTLVTFVRYTIIKLYYNNFFIIIKLYYTQRKKNLSPYKIQIVFYDFQHNN